ncbi:MAG: sodium-dependent transporter [Bacteroidetes bacterium]|nr:sodium-dependent transporter [Bacteroidota bacterium]
MVSIESSREQWGSKIGFILAAAGGAIGLGNIWKFPYVMGQNGGAAFIAVYLLCVLIIGLPILIAEVLLGRTAQRNPVGTFKALTKNKMWRAVGGMGVVAGFVILSFYGVVAGWSFGYIIEAIKGSFFDYATPSAAGEHFNELTQNVYWITGLLGLFMGLTMMIVYFGINKGIERGSKIMMPVLFVLLLIMMFKGLSMEGAEKGLEFLFIPNWSKLTGLSVLEALGHAFFTLSLGMGAMMTYGSYMSKKDNVITASAQIVALDTLIALVAGVAILTAIFSTGQNPAEGPGLIFHTLPIVFTKMTGGYIFSIIFFILLSLAALTSSISLLEVVTSYFVDEKGMQRHKAVLLFGTVAFLCGVPSALSFNILSDTKIFGLNFFDMANFLASNIFLPLGGLFISIFVAYVWGFDKALIELKKGAEEIFEKRFWEIKFWKIVIKYFCPVLIFLVLLHSIGVLTMIINLFQ